MIFSGHSRSLHLLRAASDDDHLPSPIGEDSGAASATPKIKSFQDSNRVASIKLVTEKASQWYSQKPGVKVQTDTIASTQDGRPCLPVESKHPVPQQNQWPNGPPPKGPRSYRGAISPPNLGRSQNEANSIPHIFDHGANATYTLHTFPSSVQLRPANSQPEAQEVGSDIEAPSKTRTSSYSPHFGELGPRIVPSASPTSLKDQEWKGCVAPARNTPQFMNSDPKIGRSFLDANTIPAENDTVAAGLVESEMCPSAHSHVTERLTHLSPLLQRTHSGHHDETASVISDHTTSSGAHISGRSSITSTTKTKQCHKCKKAGQTISPLFRCSKCPRRYHSHCAAPKIPPGNFSGPSEWTCKHCVTKQQEQGVRASSNSLSLGVDFLSSPQQAPRRDHESSPPLASAPAVSAHNPKSSVNLMAAENQRLYHTKEQMVLKEASINGLPNGPASSEREGVRSVSDGRLIDIRQVERYDPTPLVLDGSQPKLNAGQQDLDGSISSTGSSETLQTLLNNRSSESTNDTSASSASSVWNSTTFKLGLVGGNDGPTEAPRTRPALTNGLSSHQTPMRRGGLTLDTNMINSPCSPRAAPNIPKNSTVSSPSITASKSPTSLDDHLLPAKTNNVFKIREAELRNVPNHSFRSATGKIPQKHLTCYYWKSRGHCRYREEECQYAHQDTGRDVDMPTSTKITCYWWYQKGFCRKSDEECLYAHWDTGTYAERPGMGNWSANRAGTRPSNRNRDSVQYDYYEPSRSPTRLSLKTDHYEPSKSPRLSSAPSERSPGTRNMVQHDTIGPLDSPRYSPVLPDRQDTTTVIQHSNDHFPPSTIPESSWDRPRIPNQGVRSPMQGSPVDPRLVKRPSLVREPESPADNPNHDTPDVMTNIAVPMSSPTPMTVSYQPMAQQDVESEVPPTVKSCNICQKKVFGSASLCFSCRKLDPFHVLRDAVKKSPFISDTPDLITEDMAIAEDIPITEDQLATGFMTPISPDKSTTQMANSLKRAASTQGLSVGDGLFITKKPRIFKPSKPRKSSSDMNPPIVEVALQKEALQTPLGQETPSQETLNNATKTSNIVPSETPSELAKLRKLLANAEKLREEESCERLAAEQLHMDEKRRADKLNAELQALKIRVQEVRSPSQTKEKQGTLESNQNNKELEDENLNKQSPSKKTKLTKLTKFLPEPARFHPNSKSQQGSESVGQIALPLAKSWSEKDELQLVKRLKARRVGFELDNDSEELVEVPSPKPRMPPKDPLWRRPKSSRDLIEVAPQYQQENLFFNLEAKKKEIATRLSRKKTFGKVLALSNRERGGKDVHREVARGLPPRLVQARIPTTPDVDILQAAENEHLSTLATPYIQELDMTFEDFLGIPENVLLCKTTTDQLAYRDGRLDIRGKMPRVPDEDKFEVGAT